MGTSVFAVPALRALVTGSTEGAGAPENKQPFDVKLVITRPNAASGRGKALIPSPVRICAEDLSIPTITPSGMSGGRVDRGRFPVDRAPIDREPSPVYSVYSHIAALEPDFIIVASYGMILPQELLNIPRYGCINIHASLLPRWRGAAPIQRAILAGDEMSGVSIMRMEEGLDTGAVCNTVATPLEGKSTEELTKELAELGARLLILALPQIADGSVEWREQADEGLTYANKIGKSELFLSPEASALTNIRRVLASTPQAPARCVIGERSVTILDAAPANTSIASLAGAKATASCITDATALQAGTVRYLKNQFLLSAIDGDFEVISLKPDGKKAMDASAFVAGFKGLHKDSQDAVLWSAITREAL